MNEPGDVAGQDRAAATQALVERAAAGDSRAIHLLIQQHVIPLRAFVRLRCGAALRAKESASDLVQSACRDVLQNMGTFRWEGEASFRSWLYTAASRKVADRAEYWQAARRDMDREESRDSDQALLQLYRRSASPSQVAMGRESLDRIEAAFDELPEDHRDAVVLSRVLGLSRAEVAMRMGRSEDSVRHLLFRGLAQLGRRLLA